MTVFLLRRTLRLADQTISVPVALYRERADADRACATIHQAQASMLDCLIVRPGKDGEAEDTGVRVGRYLGDLGVLGFKTEVTPIEVTGGLVEVATQMPRIVQ